MLRASITRHGVHSRGKIARVGPDMPVRGRASSLVPVGYTKSFLDASPQLEDGLTAELMLADRNRTAVFKLTNKKWCPTGANDAAGADSRVCMRIAMLPHNTFPATNNFVNDRAHALIGRLDKPPPTPFHRLRLDRYDEFDLGGLEKRMKDGGLWFLS